MDLGGDNQKTKHYCYGNQNFTELIALKVYFRNRNIFAESIPETVLAGSEMTYCSQIIENAFLYHFEIIQINYESYINEENWENVMKKGT